MPVHTVRCTVADPGHFSLGNEPEELFGGCAVAFGERVLVPSRLRVVPARGAGVPVAPGVWHRASRGLFSVGPGSYYMSRVASFAGDTVVVVPRVALDAGPAWHRASQAWVCCGLDTRGDEVWGRVAAEAQQTAAGVGDVRLLTAAGGQVVTSASTSVAVEDVEAVAVLKWCLAHGTTPYEVLEMVEERRLRHERADHDGHGGRLGRVRVLAAPRGA